MKSKLFRRMRALTLAFVMTSGFAPGVQAAKKNPCTQQSAQASGFENETASLKLNQVGRYDITDPTGVTYANYINSRDFSTDTAADDSPEGLKFVPASESPTKKALFMAACEVGGTVAVYELNR